MSLKFKKNIRIVKPVLALLFFITIIFCNAQDKVEHPNLILTKKGVALIKKELGTIPIFDATLQTVQKEVDAEIALGIFTPTPKDFSGGYTHERHKRNFLIAQKAGVLFQITEDEKYAIYIKNMLFQYEEMYKSLPIHPQERSYARGKLFWQCLNDSNWLVYVSQAYDCIYDWLSKKERKKLEKNLFRPFADFISVGNPQFYNRVHNHSTWGNAAVGMIGLVMNDDDLIKRALYGISESNIDMNAKDNDGGFLYTAGKAGFLANLEEPFSPEGYYTEGPYYQRYAMYPFLIFAQGLHNVKPELKIFEHKDSVLLKSVTTLLNLTDADGEFFPLNDGQKGMSYYSRELVTAVDIAYHFGGNNPELLSVAEKQNRVVLDDSGLDIALGIKEGKVKPFIKKSINLRDGAQGKQGGVGILRYGNEELTAVFKYAAQGLSHGHYDKLSYSLYEKGDEVLQDYGLARFVNIEHKGGGNYLKENTTWAKQTIAHNTLVQNETSHFSGKYEIGSKHHSELYFFNEDNPELQIVSAKENNAYPGTQMHRTLVMLKSEDYEKPILLDILKVKSAQKNQYDLPFYYMGQVMKTNFKYSSFPTLNPLGVDNGYQHLWKEAEGVPSENNSKLMWLNNGKFYSLTTITEDTDELIFSRLGANDPEFNLRRDAGFLIRRTNTQNTLFVSAIEPHGNYSPVSEFAVNAYSTIKEIKVVLNTADYTAISVTTINGGTKLFIMANTNASKEANHSLKINNKNYTWLGTYYYN
ncbi:alginate lyase [Maribacter vaceletii]|uniref:Alginate lyase n=1 Tax=Maribacter vaceletii TaxID=1206816 RepID=A0A495EEI6_9FLAO|nr:alginate lyase family protein [Maribacter vaceletii]RKR15330.1 alginate lyase [Maribacter vaceletii]